VGVVLQNKHPLFIFLLVGGCFFFLLCIWGGNGFEVLYLGRGCKFLWICLEVDVLFQVLLSCFNSSNLAVKNTTWPQGQLECVGPDGVFGANTDQEDQSGDPEPNRGVKIPTGTEDSQLSKGFFFVEVLK